MRAPKHNGGVDFGLLLTRLVLGLYVALAGLGKLGIFGPNPAAAAEGNGDVANGAGSAGEGAGAATQPAGDAANNAAATQPVEAAGDAANGAADAVSEAFHFPVTFQWPGFGKMGENLSGFVNTNVMPMKPDWLPDVLASTYGYAIPFAEVILGVLVVIGLLTRFVSTLLLIMIGSFTYVLATKGPGFFAHGPGPFSGNALILAVLLLFIFAGPGRVAFDRLGRDEDEEPEIIEEEHDEQGDRAG